MQTISGYEADVMGVTMSNFNDSDIFFESFPAEFRSLLTGSGKDFVKTAGDDIIREAVLGILIGENLRNQTEFFTKRRLLLISASLFVQCLRLSHTGDLDNVKKILTYAGQSLQTGRKNMNWISQWFLGLTGKSVQNVLRSDFSSLDDYVQRLSVLIRETSQETNKSFGELKLIAGFKDKDATENISWDWEKFLLFTMVVGAGTLAIRGSEKSMYGKLFGNMVLGTILSIFGYQYLTKEERTVKQGGTFWLSDLSGNRESDATLVYQPGKIIRFDIGFIGKGNPEMSKDKLSRFERELETLGKVTHSKTIVIVDSLTTTQTTARSAKKGNAAIIQMSMALWPRQLALELSRFIKSEHPLAKMTDEEAILYLQKEINNIQINNFF